MARNVQHRAQRVCENGAEETLRMCLALTKEEANPDQYRVIVETLLKIFQNTARDPQAEKFRRLRTANATFRDRVWRFDGAQQFMLAAGWIQVDEGVVLPNDVQLTVALQLLEGEHRLEGQTSAGHTSQLTPEEVKKQAIINEERRKREAALRREKEERKRIRDQIKADRKDTSTRESKDSHATHLTGSSGGMTKFEDIGVNLSQGGG